jgi:hypothetical protein
VANTSNKHRNIQCGYLNVFIKGLFFILNSCLTKRMRWSKHVARIGGKRNACRLLAGIPERKRPLRKPRRVWVDNIKIDIEDIEWDDMNWIGLAQDMN